MITVKNNASAPLIVTSSDGGSPVTITPNSQATIPASDGTLLTIDEVPGSGLAGGHGEDQ